MNTASPRPLDRCTCGATLVHDIGPGHSSVLCPVCDRERIESANADDYAATLPAPSQITQVGYDLLTYSERWELIGEYGSDVYRDMGEPVG